MRVRVPRAKKAWTKARLPWVYSGSGTSSSSELMVVDVLVGRRDDGSRETRKPRVHLIRNTNYKHFNVNYTSIIWTPRGNYLIITSQQLPLNNSPIGHSNSVHIRIFPTLPSLNLLLWDDRSHGFVLFSSVSSRLSVWKNIQNAT